MRKPRRFAPLLLASAFTLAGCAEQMPTSPESSADGSVSPRPTFGVATEPVSDRVTDRHLVVFKQREGIPRGFPETLAAVGGTVDLTVGSAGAVVVSGLDEEQARELAGDSRVQIVERELALAIPDPTEPATDPVDLAAAPASPGDPAGAFFFPRQWHLRAIQADAAWAEGALGSSEVTVAILDTGIGYTHADLQGLVDLDRSVSFIPADDALVQAFFPGAHPIADLHAHGTHVAATVSSNALVAAGVTSQTTLIGAKVCSVLTGLCPTGAVFAGIQHAVENGADIVNMSLGGAFSKSEARGFVSVVNRLFDSAKRAGTSIVVAAGNEALDFDHDRDQFAAYCNAPHVICVSATGPTSAESVNGPFEDVDAFAPYSNFGRSAVTVAAPGGNFSLVWAACSTFSLLVPVCQNGGFALGITGTSMASPHAAGVAALLAANGAAFPSDIHSGIRQTADDLGQPGADPYYGKGRVNALGASR